MKARIINDDFRRTVFRAEHEDLDAVSRAPFLKTDLAPSMFDGPRKALCSALPHLTNTSGRLHLDGQVAPLTAKGLKNLGRFQDLDVDTGSVRYAPTDIPAGSSHLHVKSCTDLVEAAEFVDSFRAAKSNITALAIVPDQGLRGFLSEPRFRIIPSNLWMSKQIDGEDTYFFKLVALGLLYSIDLRAGKLVIDSDVEVSETTLDNMRNVLFTVGLNLELV